MTLRERAYRFYVLTLDEVISVLPRSDSVLFVARKTSLGTAPCTLRTGTGLAPLRNGVANLTEDTVSILADQLLHCCNGGVRQ